MKKLIIGMALACFVAFGTLGIQSAVAAADNVETVNLKLDDDPKKSKKAEVKTDGKDKNCEKSCESKKSCCTEMKKSCDTKGSEKKSSKKEGGDNK